MTIKISAALAASLLLGGCTTSAVMETWIHNPDASLYASWGRPDELVPLGSGESLAIWDVRDSAGNFVCSKTFTISAAHFVTGTTNTCPR